MGVEEVVTPVYARNAIINPTIPLKFTIRRLQHGEMVVITGSIPSKAHRASINLNLLLPTGRAEIPLHIALRFDEGLIVRNSYLGGLGGSWGTEERHGGLGGLKKGQPFTIIILVKEDCFKIGINEAHFTDFRHRAPVGSINQLHIDGTIIVGSISFLQAPGALKVNTGVGMPLLPVDNANEPPSDEDSKQKPKVAVVYGPKVPFQVALHSGLSPGSVIYISGKSARKCSGFSISLKVGSSLGFKNTALQMWVHHPSRSITCNAMIAAKWCKDEVKMDNMSKYPFPDGVHFDLVILTEIDKYKISVNSDHLLEFPHKVQDLQSIRGLEVQGDVKLIHFRMC